MSDDEDGPSIFGVPLPAELVKQLRDQHDRVHMTMEQRRLEVWAFLDGLTKDQLLALRTILALKRGGLHYVDGQVAAVLRLTHMVDPDTGEDLPPGM